MSVMKLLLDQSWTHFQMTITSSGVFLHQRRQQRMLLFNLYCRRNQFNEQSNRENTTHLDVLNFANPHSISFFCTAYCNPLFLFRVVCFYFITVSWISYAITTHSFKNKIKRIALRLRVWILILQKLHDRGSNGMNNCEYW